MLSSQNVPTDSTYPVCPRVDLIDIFEGKGYRVLEHAKDACPHPGKKKKRKEKTPPENQVNLERMTPFELMTSTSIPPEASSFIIVTPNLDVDPSTPKFGFGIPVLHLRRTSTPPQWLDRQLDYGNVAGIAYLASITQWSNATRATHMLITFA